MLMQKASFSGRKLVWYSKLGADCGIADVYIDGTLDKKVDTFSADEFGYTCLFQTFAIDGEHTIRIVVAGEHGQRGNGNFVHIDGLQITPMNKPSAYLSLHFVTLIRFDW